MKRVSCIIHIRDGHIMNKSAVKKMFDELTDGRYLTTVESKTNRSLPQNAFLHGVLIPEFRAALNSVGYDEVKTDAQAKEIMKAMFCKRQVTNKETGEVLEYIQNTSDMTREEMSILYDEVIKFCAENMNHIIPYPNEILTINF